jgi:hypothetical protein
MKEKIKQETEQKIQSRKIKQLEADGYYVIKLIRTNKNGIPDLIAIPKSSDVLFIEVKRPGRKRTPLQEFRGKELEQHGVIVQVYDGK